jgi:hypothetical protein
VSCFLLPPSAKEDAMSGLSYFYIHQAEHFVFYRIPKVLFTEFCFAGLSTDAHDHFTSINLIFYSLLCIERVLRVVPVMRRNNPIDIFEALVLIFPTYCC